MASFMKNLSTPSIEGLGENRDMSSTGPTENPKFKGNGHWGLTYHPLARALPHAHLETLHDNKVACSDASLMALGYEPLSPAPLSIIQGLMLCIKDISFHHTLIELETEAITADIDTDLLLLNLLDFPAWFRLYSLVQENTRSATQRLRELAANLKTINDDDAREQKEWAENSSYLMRRFMDSHGKKLHNDPLIRQKRRHLLNGFDEVSLSPQSESSSSLIPIDLDEDEQQLANQSFAINNPTLNLSKNPFESYTDPYIPCRYWRSCWEMHTTSPGLWAISHSLCHYQRDSSYSYSM
ncbi:hypothetical protein GOP47_0022484, partial [Adiantum capillus-veneris]